MKGHLNRVRLAATAAGLIVVASAGIAVAATTASTPSRQVSTHQGQAHPRQTAASSHSSRTAKNNPTVASAPAYTGKAWTIPASPSCRVISLGWIAKMVGGSIIAQPTLNNADGIPNCMFEGPQGGVSINYQQASSDNTAEWKIETSGDKSVGLRVFRNVADTYNAMDSCQNTVTLLPGGAVNHGTVVTALAQFAAGRPC